MFLLVVAWVLRCVRAVTGVCVPSVLEVLFWSVLLLRLLFLRVLFLCVFVVKEPIVVVGFIVICSVRVRGLVDALKAVSKCE